MPAGPATPPSVSRLGRFPSPACVVPGHPRAPTGRMHRCDDMTGLISCRTVGAADATAGEKQERQVPARVSATQGARELRRTRRGALKRTTTSTLPGALPTCNALRMSFSEHWPSPHPSPHRHGCREHIRPDASIACGLNNTKEGRPFHGFSIDLDPRRAHGSFGRGLSNHMAYPGQITQAEEFHEMPECGPRGTSFVELPSAGSAHDRQEGTGHLTGTGWPRFIRLASGHGRLTPCLTPASACVTPRAPPR